MLRVMLDSCVFDELLKDLLAQQLLEQAIVDGRVQVLTSHIQRDELMATRARDPEKSDKLLEVWTAMTRAVPTAGAVWGTSRWGEANFFNAARAQFDSVMRTPAVGTKNGLPGHTNDALIVETARHEDAVFVTVETGRAKKLAAKVGVRTLSSDEFIDMIHRNEYRNPPPSE